MVLPPSFSRKMGEIKTVEAEKMGWLDLPRGTSYPTFPYLPIVIEIIATFCENNPIFRKFDLFCSPVTSNLT